MTDLYGYWEVINMSRVARTDLVFAIARNSNSKPDSVFKIDSFLNYAKDKITRKDKQYKP